VLRVVEANLGEDEKLALAKVVDSGWITMGDQVRAFERAFAEEHGAVDAVAVSSCTAGLHLAMQALEIGPGDEVLVPSLTFVATVNSVLYAGANPVFVDIVSLDEPHMCCADAAAKCTARTKAVVVMHYGGYLLDGDLWHHFARTRGLHLIEDAAHAAGLDRPAGFGHAAVFSFFGNKNMTTGEGGMVFARDLERKTREANRPVQKAIAYPVSRRFRPVFDIATLLLPYPARDPSRERRSAARRGPDAGRRDTDVGPLPADPPVLLVPKPVSLRASP